MYRRVCVLLTALALPLGGAGDATEIGEVQVHNASGDPSHLAALASMVEEGTLKAAIRRTYALADAAQALADFTNHHTVGKLLITMPGG